MQEGEELMAQSGIISTVSTGGYRVEGRADDVPVSLLLDMGSAVTLIRRDIWERVEEKGIQALVPSKEQLLVSVDGSPLDILGQTEVMLQIGSKKLSTKVVVVSELTTEAILGIDVLNQYKATIDLSSKKLLLGETKDEQVPLELPHQIRSNRKQPIAVVEAVRIPPCSEVIVEGTVDEEVNQQTWLVEGATSRRSPVAVARALVEPRGGKVPLCLLNPSLDPVTVRAGTCRSS